MTQPSKNDSLFENVDEHVADRHVASDMQSDQNKSLFEDESGTTTEPVSVIDEDELKRQKQRELNAIGGALLGAEVAGSTEAAKRFLPVIENVYKSLTKQPTTYTPSSTQSVAGLQKYLNSQLPQDVRITLDELGKIYGKPIRTMSEAQEAIAYVKGAPREAKVVSVDPRTNMPRKVYSAPRAPVDLAQYKFTPNFLTKTADELRYAGDIAKSVMPSVGRIGVGALGGGLAGYQLYDALSQYAKEGEGLHMPTARTAAQLASGAGGALSMLPFGVTQAAGLALQAPELAYQGYEGLQELNKRRKQATREDVNRMLTEVDPIGNPLQ